MLFVMRYSCSSLSCPPFRTDCDLPGSGLCSFPMANVSLLRNGRDQVKAHIL